MKERKRPGRREIGKKEAVPGKQGSRRGARPSGGQTPYIYGLHAVEAALQNPARTLHKLLATQNAWNEITARFAAPPRIAPDITSAEEISRLLPPGAVHQGIALHVAPLPELDLEEACLEANRIVVLDQVTDPHNVGAILRSAAVFGASALVMTDRNSPPLTGVLAKAASGAVEHVKIAKIGNLSRTLQSLKNMGFLIVGLDGDAETPLSEVDTNRPIALVMGAEGAGLRRLTRETCDLLAKLPASGPMRSLNVSNAAAVALYELARPR